VLLVAHGIAVASRADTLVDILAGLDTFQKAFGAFDGIGFLLFGQLDVSPLAGCAEEGDTSVMVNRGSRVEGLRQWLIKALVLDAGLLLDH